MFFLERTVFAPLWRVFSWRAVRPLRALRPGVLALRIDCWTSTSPLKAMGRELSMVRRGQVRVLAVAGSRANHCVRVCLAWTLDFANVTLHVNQ